MELGCKSLRALGSLVLVLPLLAACGGHEEKAPQSPASVSTTHVSAAEMSSDVAEAPHATAPQAHGEHSDADVVKDEPRRHSERKPGGGFSGYK